MVAQRLKRLAARQETQVQSLGQEDALEMEMATHSSIVAWRILERSLVGYSPRGRKESDMTERLNFHFHFSAVATGLEKINFHSNAKQGQCQRMSSLLYNCTHFTW